MKTPLVLGIWTVAILLAAAAAMTSRPAQAPTHRPAPTADPRIEPLKLRIAELRLEESEIVAKKPPTPSPVASTPIRKEELKDLPPTAQFIVLAIRNNLIEGQRRQKAKRSVENWKPILKEHGIDDPEVLARLERHFVEEKDNYSLVQEIASGPGATEEELLRDLNRLAESFSKENSAGFRAALVAAVGESKANEISPAGAAAEDMSRMWSGWLTHQIGSDSAAISDLIAEALRREVQAGHAAMNPLCETTSDSIVLTAAAVEAIQTALFPLRASMNETDRAKLDERVQRMLDGSRRQAALLPQVVDGLRRR